MLNIETGAIARKVIRRAGGRAGRRPQAFCSLAFALPVKRCSAISTDPHAEVPGCTSARVGDPHVREQGLTEPESWA